MIDNTILDRFNCILCVIAMFLLFSCEKGEIAACSSEGLVSYNAQVQPIIQQSCATVGCHGFMNTAPFQLFTHQQVDSVAMFGSLMFSIKHQSPYPMPRIDPFLPEAYMLPDSIVEIIECWVNQGRKNN